MSGLEAYLLLMFSAIHNLFLAFCLLFGALFVGLRIVYAATRSQFDASGDPQRVNKGTKGLLISFLIFLILTVLTPTSETIIKMVLTKKGMDALQTQEFSQFVEEGSSFFDKSLKLLDLEIERRLEKSSGGEKGKE